MKSAATGSISSYGYKVSKRAPPSNQVEKIITLSDGSLWE
jgi:hypothetical protein